MKRPYVSYEAIKLVDAYGLCRTGVPGTKKAYNALLEFITCLEVENDRLRGSFKTGDVTHANGALWGKSGGMLEWIGERANGDGTRTLYFTCHDHPDHTYKIQVAALPTWGASAEERMARIDAVRKP